VQDLALYLKAAETKLKRMKANQNMCICFIGE